VFDITNPPALQGHLQSLGLSLGFSVDDSTLIIRRSLTKEGRTKCFLNDTPISVNGLKEIGEYLIEIHGQFDRLLSQSHHRMVLDEFGMLEDLLKEIKEAHASWKESLKILESTQEEIKKTEENREYSAFCLDELQKINPLLNEEELLLEKRSFLMNHEKLKNGIQGALQELVEKSNVEQAFNTAYRLIQNANADGILDSVLENMDRTLSSVQETIEVLEKKYRECRGGDDETSLESVEQRLYALRSLAKKHRCTTNDLPSLLEKFRHDMTTLNNAGYTLETLKQEERKRREAYEGEAKILSLKRKEAAEHLKQCVEKELHPLKLPAKFFVNITPLAQDHWSESGLETVEFFVTTNPGEAPGPLGKIASGGELSRFMLALKVALNQKSHVHTVIFDEIDTGLGGAVADAMGKRLKELSKTTQVLAITHSPQMAAYADHHYRVAKDLHEGRMQTTIQKLPSLDQREEELARMLSGSTITPEAKAAAAVLLKGIHS
jgi:DNA repair protein RecN (Recombination protein N)